MTLVKIDLEEFEKKFRIPHPDLETVAAIKHHDWYGGYAYAVDEILNLLSGEARMSAEALDARKRIVKKSQRDH